MVTDNTVSHKSGHLQYTNIVTIIYGDIFTMGWGGVGWGAVVEAVVGMTIKAIIGTYSYLRWTEGGVVGWVCGMG